VDKSRARRLDAIQATLITDGSFAQVNFDTVAGLTEAKQTLKEAVLFPVLYPHLFTGKLAYRCKVLTDSRYCEDIAICVLPFHVPEM